MNYITYVIRECEDLNSLRTDIKMDIEAIHKELSASVANIHASLYSRVVAFNGDATRNRDAAIEGKYEDLDARPWIPVTLGIVLILNGQRAWPTDFTGNTADSHTTPHQLFQ